MLKRVQDATGLPIAEESEAIQRLNVLSDCLVALVPNADVILKSAALGDSGTNDSGAGTQLRDLYTGKLTAEGKALLAKGELRCSLHDASRNIHYLDPLKTPIGCKEVAWLARLLIQVSEFLNQKYHLPQDDKWVTCPWVVIYNQGLTSSEGALRGVLALFRKSVRVNLRFLAKIRVLSIVLIVVFSVLLRSSWLSVSLYLPVVSVLLYFCYWGELPRYVR